MDRYELSSTHFECDTEQVAMPFGEVAFPLVFARGRGAEFNAPHLVLWARLHQIGRARSHEPLPENVVLRKLGDEY